MKTGSELVSFPAFFASCAVFLSSSEPLPNPDRCIPLTRPSSVETARCVEDSVPVARLTDLILHQLHWHSFILILDNTTDSEDISSAFSSLGISFSTVDVSVAMTPAWFSSVAAVGASSRTRHFHVVVACSSSCVRNVLQHADNFDANSGGRSIIWMTWSWLIVPRCGYDSRDLITRTFNTTMNNVAILTPVYEVTDNGGSIQTYCPSSLSLMLHPQSGRQFTLTGHFPRCGAEQYRGLQDVFPNRNYVFSGWTLTFAVKEWSSFMIAKEVEGQKSWQGSYVDLLEHVCRRLNCTYRLVEPPDNQWGRMNGSGQWDGLLGMVHRGEALAAWVPYEITHQRSLHFDFPSATDYSVTTFIYLPPHTEDKLTFLLQPLSWQVLASVAAVVPMVTILLCTAEVVMDMTANTQSRHSPNTPLHRFGSTFHRCLRMVFGALFAEASPDDWRWGGSRLMVGSWWLVTVVLAAAYSGSLVAHLSLTPPYLPFRSLEDVVKQTQYKWGVVGNSSTHQLLRANNYSTHQRIAEGISGFSHSDPSVFASNVNSHMTKVVREKYVFLGVFIDQFWKQVDCGIVRGKETLRYGMSAPVFSKDSAFTGYFSQVIDEALAAGLIDKWRERWRSQSYCTTQQGQRIVISLAHLHGVFYVAVVGLGSSLMLLLAERWFYTHRRKQRSDRTDHYEQGD